jgi:hypothetical protein
MTNFQQSITIKHAFWNTVNRTHPMGAARIVRRERYAWPGGYPLALVTHDGGLLCAECVTSEFHQISEAHHTRDSNGWRPYALTILEDPAPAESCDCDHCGRVIVPAGD